MSKIIVESSWDNSERFMVLNLKKKRGKISLSEIEDFLRYESGGQYHGHYAIIINAIESTCGGSGWIDDIEPAGDCVTLYPLEEQSYCPCCGKVIPFIDYCPACGADLEKERNQNEG